MTHIPFTVIGGFLGAGKTTLLNRLLARAEGRRFAVLVNDFGALDIDSRLIAQHGGDTIALSNGCLCCTIGDSLIQTVTAPRICFATIGWDWRSTARSTQTAIIRHAKILAPISFAG